MTEIATQMQYSKTQIYRAQIYRVPQLTGSQFYPPKKSFMCKSLWIVPRFIVPLDLPGMIPSPKRLVKSRFYCT